MLIEFRVENHRSIRDEQVLTLTAGRIGDANDDRPRKVPGCDNSLLTVAAIYGANASGKSNVLSAMGFMRDAVLYSHRLWGPDEGVPRDPFAWGKKSTEGSLCEATFLVNGVRHEYGFAVSNDSVEEEWLYAWPHGRKQIWFEREGGSFKFGEHLRGENKLIEDVTRPNALFLSTAAQHRHDQLISVYRWFRNIDSINVAHTRQPYRRPGFWFGRGPEAWLMRLLHHSHEGTLFSGANATESIISALKKLLHVADVGIVDVRVDVEGSQHAPTKRRTVNRPRLLLKHQSEDIDDSWLPVDQESHGTQTLLQMAQPVLECLAMGGVLLIDEFESSLHPLLAAHIVRQFNVPQFNPHNAQLIFATHDTNLLGTALGEPPLRRDQVWFTEKDETGGTVLYPLTDFKPRKMENLERGYLQGRYGAIPFLGDLNIFEGADVHEPST